MILFFLRGKEEDPEAEELDICTTKDGGTQADGPETVGVRVAS